MNSFFTNKKVIVTGGAGFIGSHLVEKLVIYGAQVTVLDSLITGNQENLAAVASAITFVEGDIRNKDLCHELLRDCFAVFHLAAQVSVPESFDNPRLCYETNVTGTFNLLEAAVKHTVKRFVFSSSCAVYGDKSSPCSESTECAPLSPYAYSKLMGEQLCQHYAQLFHVPTVPLRYFNVFGPRQNPNGQYAGVIAKFTECITKNEPVTIFGDGSQTRDFVPVSQIVQANLYAAQLPTSLCTGRPFNIATGDSTSLLMLVEKLKKNFPQYSHPIRFAPARPGDIQHSQADCQRFKELMRAMEG